ncbi:GFA family protein [Alphaproteobacteria bacterium KMM 3653]|uniref:GFA family protein n=1 Tax=Harenicola maris TaxID=2841044 RepID=A0AAP2G2R5_9RHOB|nr:GFA family protein [Harenicola maris]
MPPKAAITGRCYCGATRITANQRPRTVVYCHCADCRRWTGAPVGAFAAFGPGDVTLTPPPAPLTAVKGVDRWSCPTCGSPLAAQFDYLPDQTYVPVGILDQAESLAPELHCHADSRLPWLTLTDGLHQAPASARSTLNTP